MSDTAPQRIDAAAVQSCFQEAAAGRNLRTPNMEECEAIAMSVSECYSEIGKILSSNPFGRAMKDASRVIARLADARNKVRENQQFAEAIGLSGEAFFDDLVNIGLAEKSLTSLIERYGREKERKRQWHDVANLIANWGSTAWGDCILPDVIGYPLDDQGKPVRGADDDLPPIQSMRKGPAGVKPDDPLCQFVRLVLLRLGTNKEPESVSDALRFRRGQSARGGQKLRSKVPSDDRPL